MTIRVASARRSAWCGLVAAFSCFALAGCDEKLSSLAGPTPNLKPTFSSIQAEIFESSDASGRVACINCHAPGGIAARVLNLQTNVAYTNLVNVGSRFKAGAVLVVPGDPDNSYLIHKVEGNPDIVGLRMPLSGPPYLTAGQIQVIRRWIENGANND